jgi:hypothetical protein
MWLAELLLALSGDIETNPGPTFCKTCHNPFFFLGNHIHLPRKIRKLLNPHPTCPNPPTPFQKRSSTTPHRNAKQNNSQLPIPHIRDLFFSRVNTNCTEHKYHSLPSSLHIEIIFKMAARLETLGDKNIACIFCRYSKYKHNPSPPTPPPLSPIAPLLTPLRFSLHNQTYNDLSPHNPPPLTPVAPQLTLLKSPPHNQTISDFPPTLTPHISKQPNIHTNPVKLSNSPSETNLIIIQININGISNKIQELQQLINETKADIITIQETKLNASSKSPNIPGFFRNPKRQNAQ